VAGRVFPRGQRLRSLKAAVPPSLSRVKSVGEKHGRFVVVVVVGVSERSTTCTTATIVNITTKQELRAHNSS
jgi:hypothetical protein